MIRSLFARRRAVPTPSDLHADSLRRYEAAVTPALTDQKPIGTAAHAGLISIIPTRSSYEVTYKLRGPLDPDPISVVDVNADELAAEITTDLVGILGTSDVQVTVDLAEDGGLVRAHGMNVGTFDLAPIGGAR